MENVENKEIINDELNEVVDETSDDELFRFLPENVEEIEKITAPRYSYWKSVFRVFFKKKSNWIFLGLLLFILFMTYVYTLFVPFSLTDTSINRNLLYPDTWNLDGGKAYYYFGFNYFLGTGAYGESTFDYIWNGAKTSLSLAIVCATINMVVGVVIGAVWGFSKKVDAIMLEIYNVIANIPYILFISVFVMVIGSGFWSFVLALTITGWLGIAYFIRTQVLIIRDREYNLASKCLGTNIWKITTKNILPYMISVIVTVLATEVPSYISYEVFLSYIGIGLTASTPSLGRMIEYGQQVMSAYPVQFWGPVAVASAITIILYVVGQNLADASDPRTHM